MSDTQVLRIRVLALGAGLLTLFSSRLEASQVRLVSLEELSARADRIFTGRCLATEALTHPSLGVPITRVTLEVETAIKGGLASTLTIDLLAGPAAALADMPSFTPGERAVLFLYPKSALGLTSPVALGQGKFTLVRDKQGRELAVNAFGNRNLRSGFSATARERVGEPLREWDGAAGLPAAALLEAVQGLLERERWP